METFQEHYLSMKRTIAARKLNVDMALIDRAVDYAREKHTDQQRKDGTPYIIHPLAVAEIVAELARPVVEEHGCTLWDVEYVREAGQWYLRLLIDKQGGVDILDCEAISRVVSDLLDEADPIEGSYVFEVGSAGAERPLKRPADFEQFMGADVLLKTYKPRDGRKEFSGVLTGYDDGAVSLPVGSETLRFEKPEIALVRLRCDF